MICYKLRCEHGHGFEGWFPSSEAFTEQVAKALVNCPNCGSIHIEKALMAPAVAGLRENTVPPRQSFKTVEQPGGRQVAPPAASTEQDRMRVAFRQLQNIVRQHCEDVGTRFAEEAIARHRREHDGEAVAGGIFGQATPEDCRRLEDEGVEFITLPWEIKDDA